MNRRGNPPVWMWPNLLSLDAPIVAVVWQDFLVRCFPVALRPAGRIALGLTVWTIYLTDRLLDVRLPLNGKESWRHGLYRRHKAPALALLVIVFGLDVAVACFWVRPAVLEYGLFVVPGILLYLLMFVLPARTGTVWKKLMAGLFFTAGVFLVELPDVGRVAWPSAAFFLMCVGNLLLIETWERGARAGRGWIWMAALSLVCLWAGMRTDGLWFRAVAAGTAGLSALGYFEDRISVVARGVLADGVLLGPLLFR